MMQNDNACFFKKYTKNRLDDWISFTHLMQVMVILHIIDKFINTWLQLHIYKDSFIP